MRWTLSGFHDRHFLDDEADQSCKSAHEQQHGQLAKFSLHSSATSLGSATGFAPGLGSIVPSMWATDGVSALGLPQPEGNWSSCYMGKERGREEDSWHSDDEIKEEEPQVKKEEKKEDDSDEEKDANESVEKRDDEEKKEGDDEKKD
eukprot:3223685-Rhodomonas_salina.1